MPDFGNRLRKARLDARYTQTTLALELDISPTQISAWENNRETPSFRHLEKLSRVLTVSLDWLILGVGQAIPAYLSVQESPDPNHAAASLPMLSPEQAGKVLRELGDADREMLQRLVLRLATGSSG